MKKLAALLAAAAIAHQAAAAPVAGQVAKPARAVPAAGVDPLTADIDARDALRFAPLMQDSALPTADILQRAYLDGAGLGVKIFTPNRIVDAQRLAQAVAARPEHYRYAIRECLPQLPALRSDLRAIYLAYAGLLPERPLPAIKVVFGAGNSGGTANTEAQVIGLEVTCLPGTTPEQFRSTMRDFFAHETVHAWQGERTPQEMADPLLGQSLREGVADYLASLVTGTVPDLDRDAWARQRESWLWQEFQRDRQAMLADSESMRTPKASPRFRRWLANYGSAPEGWPVEAGYWVGMRIAEAYVARAQDKHAAVRELLELRDPGAILKASGYGL
ncbi:gliding motility protein GldB-related protein [Massilia sp. GCM10023247]|uniref:gliding motility protein GldB-related protein n=1 Tax=Massilia sp. GCM10023247 TaxID=3252643 RepID=UPI00361A5DD7